jgi:hypothetical protein
MTDKIRVTITMEYEPDPESYEYPDGVEDLTVDEMARQDAAIWHGGTASIADVLDWGEVLSVDFSAVSE